MSIAPYQRGSDTSREAAEKVSNSAGIRAMVLAHIKAEGRAGATIDEVAIYLSDALGRMVAPGTASARVKELEDAGAICKTPERRKTRSGRNAVVYLAGRWTDYAVPQGGPETHGAAEKQKQSRLAEYKARQAQYGHGHVIPRNDARKEGCGGPSICKQCRQVKLYFEAMEK